MTERADSNSLLTSLFGLLRNNKKEDESQKVTHHIISTEEEWREDDRVLSKSISVPSIMINLYEQTPPLRDGRAKLSVTSGGLPFFRKSLEEVEVIEHVHPLNPHILTPYSP